jgi:hypothetical protein
MNTRDSSRSTQIAETEYKKWFRKEVKAALREAANPKTKWIPHEVMLKKMAKERRKLKQLVLAEARAKAAHADLETTGAAGLGGGDTAQGACQPGGGAKPA